MNSGEWIKLFRTATDAARSNRQITSAKALMVEDEITIKSIKAMEDVLYLYDTDKGVEAFLSEPVTFRHNEFSITQKYSKDLEDGARKIAVFNIETGKLVAFFEAMALISATEETVETLEQLDPPSTFEIIKPPSITFADLVQIDSETESARPNISNLAKEDPRIFGKMVTITELKNCLIEDQLVSKTLSEAFRRASSVGSLKRLVDAMIGTRSTAANFSMSGVMMIYTLKCLIDDLLDPSKEVNLSRQKV